MSLRKNILDYLAIKNQKLRYGEGFLKNPYEFFNYESHVSSSHYKGKVYYQNGRLLQRNTDYFNNLAQSSNIEEQDVYIKEQHIPLRMHADVLYSYYINKCGCTSVLYYPFTYEGTVGVISKDLKGFKKGKVLEFEELCPLPTATNADDEMDRPYQSYTTNMKQFEKLQSESIVQSYLNLFLTDMSIQQFDRHNKNYLIVKDRSTPNYQLVALDNDITKATLSRDDETVFSPKNITYVKGIYHYIEPYQDVISTLKRDKHAREIIKDKQTARQALSNIDKVNLDDVANEIYQKIGFSVDEKLVRKSQEAKEIVCNDLDRCL